MSFSQNLEHLKVGDALGVSTRHALVKCVIVRETKTMWVISNVGSYPAQKSVRKRDGMLIGDNSGIRRYAEPWTPEMDAEAALAERQRQAYATVRDLLLKAKSDWPLDVLEPLAAAINGVLAYKQLGEKK